MIIKRILTLLVVIVFLLWAVNCASWNKKTRGAVMGGAGGAVVGGVIGHAAGNTILGAIIGAAVGGAAGAIIGSYMDKQAAEMQRGLEGAEIKVIRTTPERMTTPWPFRRTALSPWRHTGRPSRCSRRGSR